MTVWLILNDEGSWCSTSIMFDQVSKLVRSKIVAAGEEDAHDELVFAASLPTVKNSLSK